MKREVNPKNLVVLGNFFYRNFHKENERYIRAKIKIYSCNVHLIYEKL